MKTIANARFAITNWDEKPYSEVPGRPKHTRASVTRTYTGDVEGQGLVEFLMMYRGDGTAAFVGFERMNVTLGGKAGTFVMQWTGVYEGGLAKASYFVVPGSGTGELQELQGDGTSAVGHGMEHPFTLNYQLP